MLTLLPELLCFITFMGIRYAKIVYYLFFSLANCYRDFPLYSLMFSVKVPICGKTRSSRYIPVWIKSKFTP